MFHILLEVGAQGKVFVEDPLAFLDHVVCVGMDFLLCERPI